MPPLVMALLMWLLKVIAIAFLSGVLLWGVKKARDEGGITQPWIGIVFIVVIIIICILALWVIMMMPGFTT